MDGAIAGIAAFGGSLVYGAFLVLIVYWREIDEDNAPSLMVAGAMFASISGSPIIYAAWNIVAAIGGSSDSFPASWALGAGLGAPMVVLIAICRNPDRWGFGSRQNTSEETSADAGDAQPRDEAEILRALRFHIFTTRVTHGAVGYQASFFGAMREGRQTTLFVEEHPWANYEIGYDLIARRTIEEVETIIEIISIKPTR